VGHKHSFFLKPLRTFGSIAIFVALGCSSGGTPGGFDGVDPAAVRTVNRHGVNGTVSVVTPPPGGDVGDTSAILGHWYINRGGARFTLFIEARSRHLTGTLARDGSSDVAPPIEHVAWYPSEGKLRFRVEEEGKSLSYAVDVIEGTMIGRYASDTDGSSGTTWSLYSGHLTGWRRESFDHDIVPRVFDIVIDDGRFARLRVDRDASNPLGFIGELKVKATTEKGSDGEFPAQPILVHHWDGEQIVFDMPNGTARQRFSGSVHGRDIIGIMAANRLGTPIHFAGTRANVLSYGLQVKTGESRREWQERVRRILYRLMMGGNPAPLGTEVTLTGRPLLAAEPTGAGRDDNSANWRQEYRLTDVVLNHTLPNPYGAAPLSRRSHGLLAVPTTPPPATGYRLVLALNGHGGSAEQHFQSGGHFWYGDAYARRGYVVLALDVSHRPLQDAAGLYGDPPDGDSPDTSNHAHPAIAALGLDSDWSDDGERVWDAMRGIDFLLTQPSVNPKEIIVTGLSMGGEVTEIVGALDPRVTTAVPAGAPPDLSLMSLHGNHPCWQWMHGDATEFIDMSDYLSLIAPRHVILESGKWDYTYSSYSLPYAVEKENAWRARIAFGDEAANLVHYLHSGGHQYRVGDSSDDSPYPAYIQVPQLIAPPSVHRPSIDWVLDGATVSVEQTLFDYLGR
jgi:dienelactone hydrolase